MGVSSDNQRSESIDAQIRAMKAYCAQRHITIVKTYIDEAKSATTDRRPSFQQMIADSSSHAFKVECSLGKKPVIEIDKKISSLAPPSVQPKRAKGRTVK